MTVESASLISQLTKLIKQAQQYKTGIARQLAKGTEICDKLDALPKTRMFRQVRSLGKSLRRDIHFATRELRG